MGTGYNVIVSCPSDVKRSKPVSVALPSAISHRPESVCYILGRQTVGRSRVSIHVILIRGKSGLRWAGCQVTPGRGRRERFATDSATENRPPSSRVVRVKRWGKSPPRTWQHVRHGKPQLEQGQICGERRPPRSRHRG